MPSKVTTTMWYEHVRDDDGTWRDIARPDQLFLKNDEERHHTGSWLYSVVADDAKTCLTLLVKIRPGCMPAANDLTLHTNFSGFGTVNNRCLGFSCRYDAFTSSLWAAAFWKRALPHVDRLTTPGDKFWAALESTFENLDRAAREEHQAKNTPPPHALCVCGGTYEHHHPSQFAPRFTPQRPTVADGIERIPTRPHGVSSAAAEDVARRHFAKVEEGAANEPDTLSQPQGGGLSAPEPVLTASPGPEVHRWLIQAPAGGRTLVETDQFHIDDAIAKYRAYVLKLCAGLGSAAVPDLRIAGVEYLEHITVVR